MKKITKGKEPQKLADYRRDSPEPTWEKYRRGRSKYFSLQEKLRQDQGGLCAYCEIDLKLSTQKGVNSDFRVEHFHPKSGAASAHNWGLDWENLLGCCHGGSNRYVVEADVRYSSTDSSCDIPKGGENLDGIILNPLSLPAVLLFDFSRMSGGITANEEKCREAGIEMELVINTIRKLNLNSVRLRRLRKAKLVSINDKLRKMTESGEDLLVARKKLALTLMRKDASENWISFFSAIRDYLGGAAEEQLQVDRYNG